MCIIHDRTYSKKRYEWSSQISIDDTHTHNVSVWENDGHVHCRIRKVELGDNGKMIPGVTIAEKQWGTGMHPSHDEINKFIHDQMKNRTPRG